MLVTTNDAFFAIRGVPVPRRGAKTADAETYDTGGEANSESCTFIPGPPCGNEQVRDTTGAEGYAYTTQQEIPPEFRCTSFSPPLSASEGGHLGKHCVTSTAVV